MIPDVGRQYERTELAWIRTVLLLFVLGLLVARDRPGDWRGIVAVAVSGLAFALGVGVMTARTRCLSRHPFPAQAAAWQTAGLVLAILLIQAVSLLLLV